MTARLNAREGVFLFRGHPGMGSIHLKASQHLSQAFEDGMRSKSMAFKPKTLRREQIALIHVAAHQLGMGEEDYRALLMGTAGVRSSRELDQAGFARHRGAQCCKECRGRAARNAMDARLDPIPLFFFLAAGAPLRDLVCAESVERGGSELI